eukprot:1161738-Pelagomonas_calceolata.AAC.4
MCQKGWGHPCKETQIVKKLRFMIMCQKNHRAVHATLHPYGLRRTQVVTQEFVFMGSHKL